MSAEDTWQLKIPIRLSLSSNEITSPVDVKPAYLLAPRYAYLPALAEQCLRLFQHVLLSLPGQKAVSPWFEYKGLALNWTQPLGVLHDLLAPCHQTAATPLAAATAAAGNAQPVGGAFSAPAIPWCLTVHYHNMPAALNNGWQNAGTAKDHYMSSLKEAGYCCRGSDGCGAVMRLPGHAQDEMWTAISKGDGASARHIMAPLKLTPTLRQGGVAANVPVRLYIRQHTRGCGEDLSRVWEHVYSTSRPVQATQSDGSPTLLAHLMHLAMPQRFPAPVPAPTGIQQRQEQKAQQQIQQGSPQERPPAAPSLQLQQHQISAADEAGPAVAAPDLAVETSTELHDLAGVGKSSNSAADGSCTDRQGNGSGGSGGSGSSSAGGGTTAEAGDAGASSDESAAEPTTAGSSNAADATGAGSSIHSASHLLPESWPQGAAVFVCGVQPDWRTPITWLHANLQAADCFLYVVVHLLD